MMNVLNLLPEDVQIEAMDEIIAQLVDYQPGPRLEPQLVIRKRGRPSTSTKRNPSYFEIVEKEIRARN